MLGKLTDLPAIAAAAIALGLLEQGVVWANPRNPELVDPILAVVIVVCLLLRKLGTTRAEQDGSSSWAAADEVRPVPRELRSLPEVRAVRWGGGALVVLGLIGLPLVLHGAGDRQKAAAVVIFAIIAISIVMLTGWAGQVSLGQMSLVAFGAATGAYATQHWHLDLALALVLASLVGAVVALLVGLPALRLRGLFLAVTTLAFAMATTSYLLSEKHFGWVPTERVVRPKLFGAFDISSQVTYYELTLACLALVVLAVRGIRHSRTGRVLLALRENERGAQSFGVNVTRAKLTAFALSGAIAAFAGCLLVHLLQAFSIDTYGPGASFVVFTSAVVGGLGSLLGGMLGALYLQGGYWFLPGTRWQQLSTSAGVLLVLMIVPGGLSDLVYRLRDGALRWVATRRDIIVPSLLADIAPPGDDPDPDDREPRRGRGRSGDRGRGRRGGGRRGGRADQDGPDLMIPIPPLAPADNRPWHLRLRGAVRHPGAWLTDVAGDGPIYALMILFGLSMVDEMDRTAFGLLLPNIRDNFGMSNAGILSLVAVAALLGLSLQVPIAQLSDRRSRVRLMLIGAALFAMFSVGTGLAVSVWMLAIVRAGSGIGQATVGPTHNSLLADWFPIGNRPRVFSFHRGANAVGAFVGPVVAGGAGHLAELAGAVLRVRHPHRHPGPAGPAPDRARPGPPGAPGHGRHRRRHDRGAAAVVRRGLAHGVEGREPAPHLLRPALPGLRPHRLLVAGRPALRADASASTPPSGAGWPPPPSRPRSSAWSSAPGWAPSSSCSDPGLVLRFIALVAIITAGLAALFALSPLPVGRDRGQHGHLGHPGHRRSRGVRLAVAGHPGPGPVAGLLDGGHLRHPRPHHVAHRGRGVATRSASRSACC